jgi:hypothetical protein
VRDLEAVVREVNRDCESVRREERELRREERKLRHDEWEYFTLCREPARDVAVNVADAAEAPRSKREERQEERQIESGSNPLTRGLKAIEKEVVAELKRRGQCCADHEVRRDEQEQSTLGKELDCLIAAAALQSEREERQEERQIESGLDAAMAEEIRLERELLTVEKELTAANFESDELRHMEAERRCKITAKKRELGT